MKFYEILRQRRIMRMVQDSKKDNLDGENKKKVCQYPIGDPRSSGFHFCCAPVERNRFVYCDVHASICYTNFDEIKDKPRGKYRRG